MVRGPATLLYGSNAVGGVVNILDDRVPDAVQRPAVHGAGGAFRAAPSADERAGAPSLNGGAQRLFAWHADFLRRETDDLGIPGFAESAALRAEEAEEGEEHEEVAGRCWRTRRSRTPAAPRASRVVGRRGFLGVAVHRLRQPLRRARPRARTTRRRAAEEEPAPEEARRPSASTSASGAGTCAASCVSPSGGVRNVRAARRPAPTTSTPSSKATRSAPRFTNESWEGRLELHHEPLGPFTRLFRRPGRATATSPPSARRPSCRPP